MGLSAGTGKLCIFGHLGLVFIWSCFVSCLLLLLYYVICAPVLTEGTGTIMLFHFNDFLLFLSFSSAFANIVLKGNVPSCSAGGMRQIWFISLSQSYTSFRVLTHQFP